MSSSHSLHGFPLLNSPSIVPNITSFTSLLSFILHVCRNKFCFLSMICCMMFFLHCTLLRTSSFAIFCSHLILFCNTSFQKLAICFCLFSLASMFRSHTLPRSSPSLLICLFWFPYLYSFFSRSFQTVP